MAEDAGVDQASCDRGDFWRETGLRCGVIGWARRSLGGVGAGSDVNESVGGAVVLLVLTGDGARVGRAVSEGDAASGEG